MDSNKNFQAYSIILGKTEAVVAASAKLKHYILSLQHTKTEPQIQVIESALNAIRKLSIELVEDFLWFREGDFDRIWNRSVQDSLPEVPSIHQKLSTLSQNISSSDKCLSN